MKTIQAPSPNHDARDTPVDTLILHYTDMRTGADAIARLRDPVAKVSAHYVVEEDGAVFALVPEDRRAWHAGLSHWRGHDALNGRSIGIEVVNPGHSCGYRAFPALQMAAVCDLCLEILARHPIPPRNVVAHSDVSPDRKRDPGELFDWRGLAANGVGLFPDVPGDGPAPADEAVLLKTLADIGFRPGLPARTLIEAFQRHWRPERVDGRADAGTLARAEALLRLT
ncbi:N-acetylmuramoyl-L-alanine amidase [Humitalea sp. 24SJ18S-53]|uniref:N-acetylmuramoyl-L-alanine amidase n=1 Tax=Humitalea sp. 24SJ18S-53 TaxID=3422307 RepID=UPI003D672491